MVRKGYERVMCERWVVDWTNTATYWPLALLAIAALLSHPAGLLNRGPWGPSSLLGLVLTASNCNNWLQTPNWTSCRTGLDHSLTATCFLWASHLHRIQPVHSRGYTLISSGGCTCSLIDGWVNMLQIFQNFCPNLVDWTFSLNSMIMKNNEAFEVFTSKCLGASQLKE